MKELEEAQTVVGEFGGDNRAELEEQISGHIDMVHDLLQYGESILFLGRPGVGKTTVMREMARVLADELHKRVVIVDTSNEIAGDGDIPHGECRFQNHPCSTKSRLRQ
ncbi:hypothetical protein MKX03_005951 [Papaver bracteatum]|nr:hypothetical protein MKX03_005951 [Papaver bracteatum]